MKYECYHFLAFLWLHWVTVLFCYCQMHFVIVDLTEQFYFIVVNNWNFVLEFHSKGMLYAKFFIFLFLVGFTLFFSWTSRSKVYIGSYFPWPVSIQQDDVVSIMSDHILKANEGKIRFHLWLTFSNTSTRCHKKKRYKISMPFPPSLRLTICFHNKFLQENLYKFQISAIAMLVFPQLVMILTSGQYLCQEKLSTYL